MKVNKKKMQIALARKCMSLSEAAKVADMPYQSILNAQKGRGVSPVTLGKIARALGVDPADIIEDG